MDRRETHNEFAYAPKLAGLDDIGSSLITLTVDLARYRANLRELCALAHPCQADRCGQGQRVWRWRGRAAAHPQRVRGNQPGRGQRGRSAGTARARLCRAASSCWATRTRRTTTQIIHSGCQLCAYRPENIPALAESCRELKHPLELHVKVDTGMARLGVGVGRVGRIPHRTEALPADRRGRAVFAPGGQRRRGGRRSTTSRSCSSCARRTSQRTC